MKPPIPHLLLAFFFCFLLLVDPTEIYAQQTSLSTKPCILDTDLGTDPDDLIALLFALSSPEIHLELVITGDESGQLRARMAQGIIKSLGYSVPVSAGLDLGNHHFLCDNWVRTHPELTRWKSTESFLVQAKRVIDKHDKILYVNINSASNLAALLETYPEIQEKLVVYQMGGDLNPFFKKAEFNIRLDVPAFQKLLHIDIPLSLVLADTTFNEKLAVSADHPLIHSLRYLSPAAKDALEENIHAYQQLGYSHFYLHDPLTFSAAIGKEYVSFYKTTVRLDNEGLLSVSPEGQPIRISFPDSKADPFVAFLIRRFASTFVPESRQE